MLSNERLRELRRAVGRAYDLLPDEPEAEIETVLDGLNCTMQLLDALITPETLVEIEAEIGSNGGVAIPLILAATTKLLPTPITMSSKPPAPACS